MWYPGDTGGYATANVLLGQADPAGRLPFTWPAALGQGVANQPATHPERTSNGVDANGNYCPNPGPGGPFGASCTTTYTEGIYVGYRWYDQQHETPLYPFGYGLSYTHFAYSGLHWAPARDGGVDVAFRVTNTGERHRRRGPAGLPGRRPPVPPAGRGLRRPGPRRLQPDHPASRPVPASLAARAAAPAPVLGHPVRKLGDRGRSAAAVHRRQRAGPPGSPPPSPSPAAGTNPQPGSPQNAAGRDLRVPPSSRPARCQATTANPAVQGIFS